MVELTPDFIIFGIIAIILVTFGTLIGSAMIYKYFKYKYRPLLLWGLCWVLLMRYFLPYAINFILLLIGREILSPENFLIIAYSSHPLTTILWVVAWTEIMYKKKIKLFASIAIIYGIIFQIIFWTFFFTDVSLLITRVSPFSYEPEIVLQLPFFSETLLFLILAFLLYRVGHKTTDKEIRAKGTFFFVHSISFFLAIVLYVIIRGLIGLILSRIFMMFSAVCLYTYLVWPNWVKKIILREK
ncbi:MAG: hypothetical protein ACFFAN_20695 [Promethearchaeota archaeon]